MPILKIRVEGAAVIVEGDYECSVLGRWKLFDDRKAGGGIASVSRGRNWAMFDGIPIRVAVFGIYPRFA